MVKFLLAVVGIGLCQVQWPSFSSLKWGDVILVDYESRGCFHDDRFQLKFEQRNALTVAVAVVNTVRDKSGLKTVKQQSLGSLTLTKKEATGLDKLLTFYRSGPGDGCTTVDKISFRKIQSGRTVGQESFVDASCSDTLVRLSTHSDVSIRESFGKEQAKAIAQLRDVVWVQDLIVRVEKKRGLLPPWRR